jgi:hypothetical protein
VCGRARLTVEGQRPGELGIGIVSTPFLGERFGRAQPRKRFAASA